MRRFKSAVQLASLVIVIITGALAAAQEFPTKPIELAVPYAAGGSHDLTARALASVAHQYLGQPLLVVLKPGGGGAPGFSVRHQGKAGRLHVDARRQRSKYDLCFGPERAHRPGSFYCHRPNQLQPRGLCRKFDFEPAPLVLAMILGPQLEASLRRSLIYSRGDLGVFFERPIAAALMVLALLMLLSPLLRWVLSRKFSGIVEVSDA